MPPDSPYPAPFDTSTFLFPAEWHAFSDLLGGADTGLLFLRDGEIIHLNSQLAAQLGFEETELVGQPVESLFPASKHALDTSEQHDSRNADGAPIRLMTKSGTPIDFLLIENRIDTLTDARCTVWVLRPARRPERDTSEQIATQLQAVTEHLPDLVLVCDSDRTLMYANQSFHGIADRGSNVLLELAHQEDRQKLRAALEQAAGADAAACTPISFRIRHHDGSWRHLAGQVRNLLSHPDVSGLLLNASDVTAQIRQQQTIAADKKRQLHYLNRLFRMAQRPHANLASALTVVLKASTKALGTHHCAYWEVADDPSATRCVMAYDDIRQNFVDEAPDARFSTALHPLLCAVLRSERQMVVMDVDQDPRAALSCEYFHAASIKATMMVPVRRADKVAGLLILSHVEQPRQWSKDEAAFANNVAGLISLIFNEIERSKTDVQLRHLAHHDSLTGLPNRHFLFEQAADIFPKVTAETNTLAAFFIDLDGFKSVNDSLGHATGDELLKAVAMRLKNVVRKDDILVRLGGDEFMLLARHLSDMHIAEDIALQIVEAMRSTFSLQGRELQISASVGIALYPFDGTDIETLMKKADIAMYHAKSAGRDQYRMFASRLNDSPVNRSTLERELQRAIDEGELQHYYQPQVDLGSGKVRCVEALLRWHHPQHGVLLPADFLPAAEQSGLISRISAWALNDACKQLNAWDRQGLSEFTIAINLSASQLMDRALLPALEHALERSGVAAHRLEWEIKESTVMHHNTMSISMLNRMTEMHIGLSIDDFGTGYSNMAHLRHYPVHKVKIDSSFVNGLPGKKDDCAITDAIISMALPLGFNVVAEGVETQQQMAYLREHGCDIAQGYFFTQPLTAEQFEKWLVRH
jgi:diguanylate cyclase (GGDEF)-like protein/PAS domain S-box-containing protein